MALACVQVDCILHAVGLCRCRLEDFMDCARGVRRFGLVAWGLYVALGVVLSLGVYGCFSRTGGESRARILEEGDFFAVSLPVLVPPDGEAILLWPDDRNLYLQINCDFRDMQGALFLPIIRVQYRSWTDSVATGYQDLWLNSGDYYVSRDTVVIVPERVRHLCLEGGMFSFRARLESREFRTGWVRLPMAVQFYPAGTRGVPKQPQYFKLIP